MTNVDINSGAIDGTTIGATSAAAATFTNCTSNSFLNTVSTHTATKDDTGSGSSGALVAAAGVHLLAPASGDITFKMPTSTTNGRFVQFIKSNATHNAYLYFTGSSVILPGDATAVTANLELDTVGQGAMFVFQGSKWYQLNGGYSDITTTT